MGRRSVIQTKEFPGKWKENEFIRRKLWQKLKRQNKFANVNFFSILYEKTFCHLNFLPKCIILYLLSAVRNQHSWTVPKRQNVFHILGGALKSLHMQMDTYCHFKHCHNRKNNINTKKTMGGFMIFIFQHRNSTTSTTVRRSRSMTVHLYCLMT